MNVKELVKGVTDKADIHITPALLTRTASMKRVVEMGSAAQKSMPLSLV